MTSIESVETIETDNLPHLPESFVRRMNAFLGEEYELFERSYEKPRVQGLRLNRLKGNIVQIEKDCRAHFALEPVLWAECGFYYGKEDGPGKHPYHEAGLYYIQEPSAMAVVEALEPEPGDTVLDLCAAPGGKSTQIAAALQGEGILVSNEVHPARAKILSQNIERIGVANGVVTSHDVQTLAKWLPAFFDKIVVDAPCSGEGMFRKEPKTRAQWTPDSPHQCSLRQREILDSAALMLKPGGRMVYSTCTFAPEENEETIEAFLQKHPEFSIEKPKASLNFGKGCPQWTSNGGRRELENTLRLWPHRLKGEGHYLAVLRRDEGEGIMRRAEAEGMMKREKRTKEEQKKYFGVKNKEQKKAFHQFCQDTFLTENEEETWLKSALLFGEQLYFAPPKLPDITGKKVLRPGLHLGTFKKNRFEPSHALALYLKKEQVRHWINLDSQGEKIIRYLKGESLNLDDRTSGWVLVTVDGYSLGWGKLAGGQLKNHYPKGLRWL